MRGKIAIEISNITEAQAQEFVRLFGWMNTLGGQGSSRGARISYDGDGGARAIIRVNGEEPKFNGKLDCWNNQFRFD
jgi:hypothetical protein